jgi:uncharacterized membrane protein
LSVGSVGLAWATTTPHTIFTTRYARIYYDGAPMATSSSISPIRPSIWISHYLAFTVGMTFQVSDTDLKTKTIRAMVLRQSL